MRADGGQRKMDKAPARNGDGQPGADAGLTLGFAYGVCRVMGKADGRFSVVCCSERR
jgi:hypothetical protein